MSNFLALLAFGLALVVTPALARFLTNRNVIDRPDGNRKLHARPVPRLGGVALFSVFVITMLIGLTATKLFTSGIRFDLLLRLTPALLIIFCLGLLDDLFSLTARHKLVCQVCAAIVAVAMGIRFGANSSSTAAVILLQSVLTIVWLVLCTNAFNLIDGVDGLAAGLGLIFAVTLAIGGAHANQTELLLISLVFAGCLLGFLWHNFAPASIFLGDSGSLTIGFLLSALGVMWSNQQTTITGKLAPAVAFAVPLADVFLSVLRRFLAGRHIFSPDRDHIHHRLLRNGIAPPSAALLLYAAAGLASLTAIICVLFSTAAGVSALVALACVTLLCLRQLNYVEFGALSAVARNWSLSPLIHSYMTLSSFKEAVKETGDRLAFWTAIKQACVEFGFDDVRLTWGGQTYEDNLIAPTGEARTSFFFSINEEDSLVMTGNFSPRQHGPTLEAFVQTVRDELEIRGASQLHAARRVKDRTASERRSVAIR